MTHKTEEWIGMASSSSKENERVQDDGEADTTEGVESGESAETVNEPVVIYGWRKRCLFLLITLLMLLITVNICITLWFMEVMQFSMDGMGNLKIIKGGIVLEGNAYFMDQLTASSISSRLGKPISFVSSKNLSFDVLNDRGNRENRFVLKNDTVKFSAPSFNVTNERGDILFSASKNQIIFGTKEVHFTGQEGVIFDTGIVTPVVKGPYKRDLRIESVTRNLKIIGPTGVVIDSRAGDISLSCLQDLRLESAVGAIKLESSKIFIPRLPIVNTSRQDPRVPDKAAEATTPSNSGGVAAATDSKSQVYQVCVCGNGKLFLSPADGECATDNDSFVCLSN